jgi:hypothetical protein
MGGPNLLVSGVKKVLQQVSAATYLSGNQVY